MTNDLFSTISFDLIKMLKFHDILRFILSFIIDIYAFDCSFSLFINESSATTFGFTCESDSF